MNDPPDKSLCFPLFDASCPRGRVHVCDLLHRIRIIISNGPSLYAFDCISCFYLFLNMFMYIFYYFIFVVHNNFSGLCFNFLVHLVYAYDNVHITLNIV